MTYTIPKEYSQAVTLTLLPSIIAIVDKLAIATDQNRSAAARQIILEWEETRRRMNNVHDVAEYYEDCEVTDD